LISRSRIVALFAAVVLSLPAFEVLAQQEAGDVESWLDRMNEAVETLNYRGTFVHVVDSNQETLRIVHRNVDGEIRERISSSDGTGREILRSADCVQSVFPEKHLVVVEEPEGSPIPLASALSYTDELENYYDMRTFPKSQVAGRDTQVVSIRAKDAYRYGYLLYLDRETALPLKSQIRDDKGEVVEAILFTEIEVVDSIPESEVSTTIDLDDYDWKRPIKPVAEASTGEIWGATRLPNGFRLTISRQSLLAGSRYPVQHLVYTDGLATVSVFIAHPKSEFDMPEGFSGSGSTNSYSVKIHGRLATALGEVPRRTVQRIAMSLDAH
jgi:sigma-E factor negative regulatory protein RseB